MTMNRRTLAVFALTVPLLVTHAGPAAAQASAPSASSPGANLSSIRVIAVDALQFARSGDLRRARGRVEALEVQWRQAEPRMRSLPAQRRQAIDTAIDRAERELRFWRARSTDSAAALQALIDVIDQSD